MAKYMTYERALEYDCMLEKMIDDNFCPPDTVIRRILREVGWDHHDQDDLWSNGFMFGIWEEFPYPDKEDKQLYYDYHYIDTFVPSIIKLYGFWKMKGGKSCNHLWNKPEGYLLAEIMWLLIEDEFHEGIQFYHKKEKGNKKTTFKEAVPQLKYTEMGNCYCKGLQHPSNYGDIINGYNGKYNLSDRWIEALIHHALS